MTDLPSPTDGDLGAPTPLPPEVRRGLPSLVVGRLVGNVGMRFTYPFLPAIARGLGVSPEAAGAAMSVRELSGLIGPAAGRYVDGGRRRAGLVIGLALGGLLLTLAGGASGIVLFTIAITAAGICKVLYDTAMSTWIGHHVPWERRGTIMGVGELAWAGSLLLGVPILGLVIETWGWRWAFVGIGVANAGVALAILARIERDADRVKGPVARLRLLPGAIGLYATMGLLSFGIQVVIVAHGFWLEDAFGWSVAAIGAASILLGVGELVGTVLMIGIADRVGKRRSLLIGATILVVPFALLGTGSSNAVWGVALLTIAVAVFEFTFVSGLPLVTEIDPEARGTGVGVALALVTVTRAIGNIVGTTIYAEIGMGWTGMVAAVSVGIAAIVTLLAVREPGRSASLGRE
jgi:predicted MFS family arabinose efflux permease